MKNQYVGDVNDYLKYGLLRCLQRELTLCVCWMLTADDGSSDGRLLEYLAQPQRWRDHDPELFDAMLMILSIIMILTNQNFTCRMATPC